jgi:hypothetical protein
MLGHNHMSQAHLKSKLMGNLFPLLRVLLCSFCLYGILACDELTSEGVQNSERGNILVNPTNIALVPPVLGESVTTELTVSNVGGGNLKIIDLYFSNSLSGLEFQKNHPDLPINLAPEEIINITITYSPQDSGQDAGELIIISNSNTGRETFVEIETADAESDLIFFDETLFAIDACGSETSRIVEFQNLGTIPVMIDRISLSLDSSAAYSLGQYILKRDGEVLEENSLDVLSGVGSLSIEQRSSLSVEVFYDRNGNGDDRGSLDLYLVGELEPRYRMTLKGDVAQPALELTPESVQFDPLDLNQESPVRRIAVRNASSTQVSVESVNLAINDPAVNAQFTLHDIDVPVTLNSDDVFNFGVSFQPQMNGSHRTAIKVSFGECQSDLVIPISGRVREPCLAVNPEALSFGRIARGERSADKLLEVQNCGDIPIDINEISLGENGADFNVMLEGMTPMTLEPRNDIQLSVHYVNNSLIEGEVLNSVLNMVTNMPENPNRQVLLSVVGGGEPSCELRILPQRMNFGLVSRGRSVTRELQVVNIGTGACQVVSQSVDPLIPIPIPGFDTVKFTLTQPIAVNTISAGEFVPFEITYTPEIFNADVGVYKLTYYDRFTDQNKEVTADLAGISGESNIEVIPARLDFGQVTAGDCASREERVTVYNTGAVDLCITNIQLEGECQEFLITDRPVADADGCIVVTRNVPADVKLVYEPGNLGLDECELIFTSDAADTPELRVPLSGEGVSNNNQVDEFVQTSGQTVDVLFVVDNSGSMSEEQENLEDNFAEFISGAQRFQNDYQIGVVTTDMQDDSESGRLQNPRVISRGPAVEAEFSNAVNVGTSGAGEEKGLAAAQAALSDPLIFDTGVACNANSDCQNPDICVDNVCGGANRGFLREDAALEVVFVSDEDDFSEASLNFYVDFLKSIKGFRNEGRFHANAIVGSRGGMASSCSGGGGEASAGSRYVEVAQRTNGRVYSICESDFGIPLQEIGTQAFGLPIQFFLSRPAEAASIQVEVDDENQNNGWSYDAQSNSIIFEDASVPQPDQVIRISYNAQCFPRSN